MIFLINASKEKAGGGLQVTDSICRCLDRFPQHQFVVVVSDRLEETCHEVNKYSNVCAYVHTFRDSIFTLATGHYPFLDDLVKKHQVQAVMTVFGPSRWAPRVPHLCGFARAHLVMPESPFYQTMKSGTRIKERIKNTIVKKFFNPSNFF